MPDPRILKILLVEDDLEDEELLSEAFVEIEEKRQWCNWRSASVVPVGILADAINCLQRDLFDIVLVNLSLPDSPTLLDSLRRGTAAPSPPVIGRRATPAGENRYAG